MGELLEANIRVQECQMSRTKAHSAVLHRKPNAKALVAKAEKDLQLATNDLLLISTALQQATEDFNKQQTTAPMTPEPDQSVESSISDASSLSVKSSISDASSQPQPPSYQDVLAEKAAEVEARRISGKKAQEDRMQRTMDYVWRTV